MLWRNTVARTKNTAEVTLDRRAAADRRANEDRRAIENPVADERRQAPRRKTPRRRQIDPTTCERDYSNQEIEFMQAMDAYKRSSGRMFPTCSEILEVLRDLGYQQVGKPGETVAEPMTPELETEAGDETESELELELDDSEEI
jgi:hypothetical protein